MRHVEESATARAMCRVIAFVEHVVDFQPRAGFAIKQLVPADMQIGQGVAGRAQTQRRDGALAAIVGVADPENLRGDTEAIEIAQRGADLDFRVGNEWDVPVDAVAFVDRAGDPAGAAPDVAGPGGIDLKAVLHDQVQAGVGFLAGIAFALRADQHGAWNTCGCGRRLRQNEILDTALVGAGDQVPFRTRPPVPGQAERSGFFRGETEVGYAEPRADKVAAGIDAAVE